MYNIRKNIYNLPCTLDAYQSLTRKYYVQHYYNIFLLTTITGIFETPRPSPFALARSLRNRYDTCSGNFAFMTSQHGSRYVNGSSRQINDACIGILNIRRYYIYEDRNLINVNIYKLLIVRRRQVGTVSLHAYCMPALILEIAIRIWKLYQY